MLSLRPLLVFPSFASSLLLLVCVFSSGGFGRNVFASQITEIAQLTDGHRDQFGAFVAMSADAKTIVVSNPEPAGGNVYVFVEPPGGWTTTSTHMAVLKVPQSVAAQFGWSVVISPDGNTLAVGAPWTNEFEGEAFVFVKPVTGWQSTSKFTAMLSASDESPDGRFGSALAARNNTIVVSGNQKAYIFAKPRDGWTTTTETAQLRPSHGNAQFGSAVAINGPTVAVGAGPVLSSDPGKVYLFERSGARWVSETETAQLSPSDGSFGEQFGISVAIDDNTVVVGADEEDVGPGAAYVFVKPSGGWTSTTETAELTASDTVKYDLFGSKVTIDRNVILVGASEGGSAKRGAVYVYDKPRSGWTTTSNFNAKLTPPSKFQGQLYGGALALSPHVIAVGAIGGDPTVAGVTYIYQH
jgi:hypothetical protein